MKNNINYRSLTQFKYAHFIRFKPSNDLSICKYANFTNTLNNGDAFHKGVQKQQRS